MLSELLQKWMSAASLPNALETEHGLVMILLLYGLLTYRGSMLKRWTPVIVACGILLSIFTPFHQIELFWPVLTALVVPLLIWQSAISIIRGGKFRTGWGVGVWVGLLLLITLILIILAGLPFSNALLLGILIVTLIWYLGESYAERTYLATIGQVALAVLLVEIDLEVVSFQFWVGTLLSGVAVGLALGFLGVSIYRRFRRPRVKNGFFFAWAYLTYLVGLAMGTSAIALTLTASIVVAVYGYSIGLWYRQEDIPVPANTPAFFYLASAIWLLLGWQAHTEFLPRSSLGIGAVLLVVLLGLFLIQKLVPARNTGNNWQQFTTQGISVLLLLTGSILFWPRQAFLTAVSVEVALGAAVLLILLLREGIKFLLELMGIEFGWPEK